MAKTFPRYLYIKREKPGANDPEFFIADEDAEALCDKGEITVVAKYELIECDRYRLVKQRT